MPDKHGLTDEEIRKIERETIIGVLIWYSPFFAYLILALLNGWCI